MKRIPAFLFAVILATAAFAQSDGCLWWGYYHGTNLPDSKLGVSKTAVYEAAIHVDGEAGKLLHQTAIQTVRLPFDSSEHIDSLTLWFTIDLEGERLMTVPVDKLVDGWNEVTLPECLPIPEEGLYVGYTFKVTELDGQSERPLIMCSETADGGLWLRVQSVKQYREWFNTRRYGSLALQLLVSGGSLPRLSASVDAIRQANVVRQTDDEVEVMFSNYGTEPISALHYAYSFGDEQFTGDYTLAEPLTNVYGVQGYAVVPIKAPEATGRMPLTFTLLGVNDGDNLNTENTAATEVLSLQFKPHRRTVMEEYTGTWCSMCPRGFAGIARLKQMYPDDFIAVSVHVLNGDPMDVYYDYYYVINTTQFPSCRFDRGAVTDPYDGDLPDGHFHADENFRQANRILAPADLDVEAEWTADSVCAIRSTVNFAYDADQCDYKLAYILIEDSLRGPEGDHSWHQKNSFSDPTLAYYVEDDMQQYVNAEGTMLHNVSYNDVVIAMSDVRGIEGSLEGPQRVGQPMTHDYELRLTPVSQNRQNTHVVALLIDSKTKLVANAALCNISGASSVPFVALPTQQTQQQFDLLGRPVSQQVNAHRPSLRLVRCADGSIRKQFNK